jgi:pyrroline-5-carboxylate reductase
MGSHLPIGFFGAGKMASALARGFIHAGICAPQSLCASDPVAAAREAFQSELQAGSTTSNLEILERAQVLILAVKPDQVPGVLDEIGPRLRANQLLISIAAGIPLRRLESGLQSGARVVRVMPNTPALVGASASAYALGTAATPQDAELVHSLFSAVGVALRVKESWLDAVTGLSGSGPAYVCLIIEALSDGGVAAGLPRDVATQLAAQTLLGTAKMVLETKTHPGVLKDMVTSPGGTTIDGLHELEKAGLRSALISAVRVAAEKSKRLGQG